jgi:hypothetical protein
MFGYPEDIADRAFDYAVKRGMRLEDQLGSGVDGIVLRSGRPSAVKVFAREDAFRRELACYRRLREREILDILGHRVPQLLDFDDSLLVIEMTVVQPPFLLDFAGAYVDTAPDYPDEVMEQWHEDKREQFGDDRWERVQMVLATLRGQCGIQLFDVNPGNITFGEGEA